MLEERGGPSSLDSQLKGGAKSFDVLSLSVARSAFDSLSAGRGEINSRLKQPTNIAVRRGGDEIWVNGGPAPSSCPRRDGRPRRGATERKRFRVFVRLQNHLEKTDFFFFAGGKGVLQNFFAEACTLVILAECRSETWDAESKAVRRRPEEGGSDCGSP